MTIELIDRLIAIKDQLHSQYNRETINEACGYLVKIERGELVEVVRCGDCRHRFINGKCLNSDSGYYEWNRNSNSYCDCGERSVETIETKVPIEKVIEDMSSDCNLIASAASDYFDIHYKKCDTEQALKGGAKR